MNNTRKLVLAMMLAAIAVVLNLVESLFIPPIAYYIHFGLANIISLVSLKILGKKEMWIILFLRVLLSALLKGAFLSISFFISISGAICSAICLSLMQKSDSSFLFLSICSSLSHSLGQISMVIYLYSTFAVMTLLPLIAIASVFTGVLTGLVAQECLKRVKKI